MCRDVLKEKYGLCFYDKKPLDRWFTNHYSSQKKVLQSEDWLSSWTEERERFFQFNETQVHVNESNHSIL